ncbi:hypothetical protein BOX15_Mlig006782g1 [Macrostomum lignano]|uniref:Uncharacterized protein n=2 Tax=Macrostomum lignano TaxID=282301 RepID=A0A267G1H2_9PLAT|nr:hypothetical protein BOX15_Mlig006782g3 [Macrostomum lignano]PAA88272.1 hypothetical protein BOX15_Mlig006782g1 [Macrostomum lignano]
MSKGCLSCLSCLCKVVIVCTNVVSIIIGLLLVAIGAIFAFVLGLLSGTLASTLESMMGSFSSSLKEYGVEINLSELLGGMSEITGSVGWGFLVLGVVLIVLSCIGCCGACCTVRGCLIIYAVMVGIMLIGQVIVISIWFSSNNLFKENARSAMEESLKKFTGISSKNIQSLLQNLVHVFVGCCGVTNGTDFQTMSPDWNRTYSVSGYSFNLTYPLTCCKFDLSTFKPKDEYCPYNNTTPETSNYKKGCYEAIFTFIDDYLPLDYLFYGLGGVLGFQCLLIVGVVILLVHDQKDNGKVKPT